MVLTDKQTPSEKASKAKSKAKPSEHATARHATQQATSKANPAPRQGKPKNDKQSFALVSDTKKQGKAYRQAKSKKSP